MPHTCLILTDHLLTPCDDLKRNPLGDAVFSVFTGGSYLEGDSGKSCAGCAIAIHLDIEAAPFPLDTSALQPELHPLT